MKASDLLLLLLDKNMFFVLCVNHTDHFFVRKLGPKVEVFRGFTNLFLELMDANEIYQY